MSALDPGILIINLGTPDAPETGPVRRYLREFLSDPRVLDISPIGRKLLLECIILPTRPAKSAEAYRVIWTERGSPLLFYGEDLVDKVRARVPGVPVELGMRYQNPSIESALTKLRDAGAGRILVFPLFPQYSSAATGSALEKLFVEAGKLWNVPSLEIAQPYYDHPAFIHAVVEVARPVLDDFGPDYVMQSYHGLPERHCTKSDDTGIHCLVQPTCCDAIGKANEWCYRAHCFATARAVAATLGHREGEWEVAFQSRLGRTPWIKPYTDERVIELAKSGVKRLAVMCPSFTADCLETIEEIGVRARESFVEHGGEELILVPCVNAADVWADGLLEILPGIDAAETPAS